MYRDIAFGEQNFARIRENKCFYVDKTNFIKEWWSNRSIVTLITRPRRFGKTLTLDMVKTFFSPEFHGRSDLFKGLSIWRSKKFRDLQGVIPVISISFGAVKAKDFSNAREAICTLITLLYNKYRFLLSENILNEQQRKQFLSVQPDMNDTKASFSLMILSVYLEQYYCNKPIILIDEYDTPMQEAWLKGYWNEMVDFLRGIFNATFKDNPSLGRGLMTGITRISKESLFSDLNNIMVVTTTSKQYSDCFGFTEKEVFDALDEFNINNKDDVKSWYDGFIFGETKNIYNPWSILGYLNNRELSTYWADTSSNALVSELIKASSPAVKENMESLLLGGRIPAVLDEQIVFSQLEEREEAIWSFLVAAGYLKVLPGKDGDARLLALTNAEVRLMMEKLIKAWFNSRSVAGFSRDFRRALVRGETAALNEAMRNIAEETFSFFDAKGREPERFYHGFTLGLLVDMKESHCLKSNRESGLGRYDVMLVPRRRGDPGVVIEFKSLHAGEGEAGLEDTAAAALGQIAAKNYAAELMAQGVPPDAIYAYGFAFQGKEVLVRGGRLADAARAPQAGRK